MVGFPGAPASPCHSFSGNTLHLPGPVSASERANIRCGEILGSLPFTASTWHLLALADVTILSSKIVRSPRSVRSNRLVSIGLASSSWHIHTILRTISGSRMDERNTATTDFKRNDTEARELPVSRSHPAAKKKWFELARSNDTRLGTFCVVSARTRLPTFTMDRSRDQTAVPIRPYRPAA